MPPEPGSSLPEALVATIATVSNSVSANELAPIVDLLNDIVDSSGNGHTDNAQE
jgi:hypothetical protein